MDKIRGPFNLDGTLKRNRQTPCSQCGELRHCDECWWHCNDWSPFGIWHCLLCRMPMFFYDHHSHGPFRCDFCGWDEKTETRVGELKDGVWIERDHYDDEESRGPPR
jgi:hypothetical protein